jgi:putative chitinase
MIGGDAMIRLVDVLRVVAPNARPEYLEAFDRGGAWLIKEGITTPVELAPFLATLLEETGGLVVTYEDMNYTHAARIREVWPIRFATDADAEPFVRQPEKLGNYVYANRMGNGGISSGDGYRYRGVGLMQTTGKADYVAAGEYAGADFLNHPELVMTADYALVPAVWEWGRSNLNALARAGDFRGITRILNGGYTNMDERERWLAIMHQHLDGQTIDLSLLAGATPVAMQLKPSTKPKEAPMTDPVTPKLPAVPGIHPADGIAGMAGIGTLVALSHSLDQVHWLIAALICVVVAVAGFVIWSAFKHPAIVAKSVAPAPSPTVAAPIVAATVVTSPVVVPAPAAPASK